MSGRQAPKTARGEETRRKLLDAADVLFYEQGIRATGVEAVAEGAGVTKIGLRDRLMELAAEAGVAEPERLAETIFLLLEGTYVTGVLEGNDEVIGRARSIAAELVASSIEDGGRRPT